jgi:hypothetical protein
MFFSKKYYKKIKVKTVINRRNIRDLKKQKKHYFQMYNAVAKWVLGFMGTMHACRWGPFGRQISRV